MLRPLFGIVILALAIVNELPAQSRYMQLAARHSTSLIYHEVITFTGSEKSSIILSYRIPNDRLVFMRSREAILGQEFVATFDMNMEVFEDGRRIESKRQRIDHFASEFDATQDRDQDYTGQIVLDLPPGTYSYRLTLDDRNAQRSLASQPRQLQVATVSDAVLGQGIAVQSVNVSSGRVTAELVNLAGDAPYGQEFEFIAPVRISENLANANLTLSYVVRSIETGQLTRRTTARGSVSSSPSDDEPLVERIPDGGTEFASGTVGADDIVWLAAGSRPDIQDNQLIAHTGTGAGDGRWGLARIDLDGELLPNGTYVLELEMAGNGIQETTRWRFATHWRNMPISLYDVDVAIRNLEFMEDRAVIREMRRGNQQERQRKFLKFWSDRNPAPDREYNELMAEYYRRIDYAAYEFRTGTEPVPDGLRTDRARIYIVFGPPVDVSREFPEQRGGVREVWQYGEGRTFVFEASSSLDRFRLVES